MTSQKDDLVDRRKVEAWQHVEPKRTNRGTAFLCPNYRVYACVDADSLVDLTSNRCSNSAGKQFFKFDRIIGHQFATGSVFGAHSAGEIPVTIPNTEVKPSSGDYTALRETSKVPNYTKAIRKGGSCLFYRFSKIKTLPKWQGCSRFPSIFIIHL